MGPRETLALALAVKNAEHLEEAMSEPQLLLFLRNRGDGPWLGIEVVKVESEEASYKVTSYNTTVLGAETPRELVVPIYTEGALVSNPPYEVLDPEWEDPFGYRRRADSLLIQGNAVVIETIQALFARDEKPFKELRWHYGGYNSYLLPTPPLLKAVLFLAHFGNEALKPEAAMQKLIADCREEIEAVMAFYQENIAKVESSHSPQTAKEKRIACLENAIEELQTASDYLLEWLAE